MRGVRGSKGSERGAREKKPTIRFLKEKLKKP